MREETARFTRLITDSPEDYWLVAEIYYDGDIVATIDPQADGTVQLRLFPTPSGTPWTFRFDSFFAFLQDSHRYLFSGERRQKFIDRLRRSGISDEQLRAAGIVD